MSEKKPTYTPLQRKSITPVHELTTHEVIQVVTYFHDVKLSNVTKRSVEGVIRILKSQVK